jgi:hypothetical protein
MPRSLTQTMSRFSKAFGAKNRKAVGRCQAHGGVYGMRCTLRRGHPGHHKYG